MDLLKCQERVKKQMALEYAPFAWSPEGRVYVKDIPCDDGLRVTVTFKKSPTSDGAVYVGIFAHEHGVGKFGNTTLHEPGSPIADQLASSAPRDFAPASCPTTSPKSSSAPPTRGSGASTKPRAS